MKRNSPLRDCVTNRLLGILPVLLLLVAWQLPVVAATLTTDKPDYQPGQHVTFTGTGWQAGENVTIAVYETSVDPFFYEGSVVAIADASGNISNSDLLVQESFLGQGFTAEATGSSSGLTTTASFTDSPSGFPTVNLPNGTAPVNPPTGGFGIDGDLQANTNSAAALLNSIGDWMPGPGGTGGNVLDSSGNPLPGSSLTYHLIDGANCPSGSACDNVFSGSNAKFDADPSLWSWKMGNANGSSDINHALIHITKDANGHIWAVVAADRGSANGDSAIDFEFLQNTLSVTTNNNGTAGGFTTDGPNGGRTTNDFILGLTFTGGGTVPALALFRWQETSPGSGTFDYAAASASDLGALVTANVVFGAVNTVVVPVSYGAFGATTYQANTFGEIAVDLTALLGSFNPCLTLGVKTIFVKTRNSQSATSSIVDFVNPQQILRPLIIGPAANAGPDQTKCEDPSGATTFVMAGTGQPGTNPLISTNWTPVSGFMTISDSHSLTPTVTVYGGSTNVTLRLTVTDAGSCSNNFETSDITLTVSSQPGCTITGDTTVFAGSTGNTYTGPNGVTGYSWAVAGNSSVNIDGSTTSQSVKVDIGSAATGTFTVGLTTTNGGGCVNTCSQLVTINPADQGCLISGPSIVCASSTGNLFSLTAQPANVTSYSWSLLNNNSGASFSPAPLSSDSSVSVNAGTVGSFTLQVTITYDNGAAITCSAPVTVEHVTLSLSKTDTTCTGTASGTITATFGGGVGPYSVSVDGGTPATASSPDLISGLNAGQHSITVVDANNCSAVSSITIGQAVPISASETTSPASCNGSSDGSVTVSVSGGAAPYSVTVNGVTHTGVTGSTTFNGLASGTYPATITDVHSCPGSAAGVLVGQPTAITASETASPASCNGGSDGGVTVSVGGGTGPYSVTLNGVTHSGVTSSTTFNGLASGTYAATITDAHSCSGSATGMLVGQPTAITASETTTPASCNGGSDGSVTVSVGGGTGPYSVTLNGVTHNGVTSSTTFNGLASGTYPATITDAHSCSGSATGMLVGQPTAITASETTTPANCNGAGGSVTVAVSGGTAPYSVTLNGVTHSGVTGSTTFTGLTSGTYPATITDAHSCSGSAAGVLVGQPTAITASETTSPASCNGSSDGSVTVSVSGGTGPYSVTLNGVTHNGVTVSTTFNGLTSGTYPATITDAHSCSGSAAGVLVGQPTAITASETTSPASCNGTSDGSVTVNVSGGSAPYSVAVNGVTHSGVTSSTTFNGLASGTYPATIIDAHSCPGSAVGVLVAQPTAIVASEITSPASCNGSSDGSVAVSVSGGTGPYSVTLNGVTHNGVTSSTSFNGLASGTYPATIIDAHSCSGSAAGVLVSQPAAITASETPSPASCNGSDGSVTVSVSGGTGPYSVTLNGVTHNGVTSSTTFNDLASGTYPATITDAHSCSGSAAGVLVGQPAAITGSETATPANCNGAGGSVTVTISGGTAPFSVTLNGVSHNGVTGSTTFTGLPSGTYPATITDAHSCSGSAAGVLVDQPAPIVASEIPSPASCNGSSDGSVTVMVSGGTGPYSVTLKGVTHSGVTGSTTFTGLPSGTYPATIADAHSCSGSAVGVLVAQPAAILASETTSPVSCNGSSDGSVTVSVSGGTGPYSVTLNGVTHNGVTGSTTFTGLPTGTYPASITDASSCHGSARGVLIAQPAALSCQLSGNSDMRMGSTGNTLVATASGGTPPYTFTWSCDKPSNWIMTGCTPNPSASSIVTFDAPNFNDTAIFTVSVTDANGCPQSTCRVFVASMPLSYVTDSSLCTFVSPFRLILSQDTMNVPCYKVTASNPGQFYYNLTYLAPPGTPAGTPVIFKITLPYPFVTQGAQPIHAYNGVTLYPGGDQLCFSPATPIFADSKQVTLGSYNGNVVGTTTTTITETVPLPANGFIYLNIHLDYGLKKAGGYMADSNGNAIACSGTGVVPIPNNVAYPFGYTIGNGNTVNTFPPVQSFNDFNKIPGTGLLIPGKSSNIAPFRANSPNEAE